jgi:DDE superfamily endonuclease
LGAVCSEQGKGAGLILPACNTEAMNLHLVAIAAAVAPGAHAVLLADQAGWHMSTRLVVPPNITIIALPPKCPELNPVENVWQFMRDNWLSNRVVKSTTISSTIAAKLGTSSPISPGGSCPSDCDGGRMGSDQGELV